VSTTGWLLTGGYREPESTAARPWGSQRACAGADRVVAAGVDDRYAELLPLFGGTNRCVTSNDCAALDPTSREKIAMIGIAVPPAEIHIASNDVTDRPLPALVHRDP